MNPSILVGGPFGPDQDKDDEMSQSKDFEDPNCEDETKAEKLEIEREKLIRVDQM
jgi:hypothetical protein